jgi:hypothetical protein
MPYNLGLHTCSCYFLLKNFGLSILVYICCPTTKKSCVVSRCWPCFLIISEQTVTFRRGKKIFFFKFLSPHFMEKINCPERYNLRLHGFYLMPNNLRPCGFYLMPSNLWLYGSIWCPYLGAICGFYLLPNKLRLYRLFLLPDRTKSHVAASCWALKKAV